MPESEFTPFLRAIHERPDDELPRLIFADYLDERGDWRGPLLRRPAPDAPLHDRPATAAWRKWLGKAPRYSWIGCRRGLVSLILPAAAAFELPDSHRIKDALRAGWVEHLDITENEGLMPWAEQFDLSELPRLGVQRADEETLERLPGMPALRRLYLNHCRASRAELGNLKEFPNLEFVHVGLTGASDDDLQRLSAVPHLQSLTVIGHDRLLNDLGLIRGLTELRRLQFGGRIVEIAGALDHLGELPNLEEVVLDQLPPRGGWVHRLLRCENLKRVHLRCGIPNPDELELLRRMRPDMEVTAFRSADSE